MIRRRSPAPHGRPPGPARTRPRSPPERHDLTSCQAEQQPAIRDQRVARHGWLHWPPVWTRSHPPVTCRHADSPSSRTRRRATGSTSCRGRIPASSSARRASSSAALAGAATRLRPFNSIGLHRTAVPACPLIGTTASPGPRCPNGRGRWDVLPLKLGIVAFALTTCLVVSLTVVASTEAAQPPRIRCVRQPVRSMGFRPLRHRTRGPSSRWPNPAADDSRRSSPSW